MPSDGFTMEMVKMTGKPEWEGGGVSYSTSDSSCFVDPVVEEEVLGLTIQMLCEMAMAFLPYIILMALLVGMVMAAVTCILPRIGIRFNVLKGSTTMTIGCVSFGFTKPKGWHVGFGKEGLLIHEDDGATKHPKKVHRHYRRSKAIRLRETQRRNQAERWPEGTKRESPS